MKILLLEDEVRLARVVARNMAEHEFLHVVSVGGAIRTLATHRDVDFIISDLFLERTTALGLHAWVQTHRPGLLERFLYISGTVDFCLPLGYPPEVPLLQKPFYSDELRNAIIECFEQGVPSGLFS